MTIKTQPFDERFTAIAATAQFRVAKAIAKTIDGYEAAEDKQAYLSGAVAGLAQVVWEARANKNLEKALEFWTFCGESYIKQFYAEDEMGEPQGGKQ